jgi:hypothetical protein
MGVALHPCGADYDYDYDGRDSCVTALPFKTSLSQPRAAHGVECLVCFEPPRER